MPFVAYTHRVTLPAKPVIWMGDSLDALREFPSTIQDEVGYALYLAQVRVADTGALGKLIHGNIGGQPGGFDKPGNCQQDI